MGGDTAMVRSQPHRSSMVQFAFLLLVFGTVQVLSFSKPNTEWIYCPQGDDPDDYALKVHSIVLDPETVERGKPFTFAISGDFGADCGGKKCKEGGKTPNVTAHVTILYDLGKKVSDDHAAQMRLKGMDVEQLEKHTSLRIMAHERELGTIENGLLTQQSDKSTLPENLPAGNYIIRYRMRDGNRKELVCVEVDVPVE